MSVPPPIQPAPAFNRDFYRELLHLLGLEEEKAGVGPRRIQRKKKPEAGSLLENTLAVLRTRKALIPLPNPSAFGDSEAEQLVGVAIELLLTWSNRVLLLHFLDRQSGSDGPAAWLHPERIRIFSDLDDLFGLLARRYPTLSLFEPTDLERQTFSIGALNNQLTLPIYARSVLKNRGGLSTLSYLIAFLGAYPSGSGGSESSQTRPTLDAAMLGLVFEKLNGDGSFLTPGFVTRQVCRQAIRRAVTHRLNARFRSHHTSFDELVRQFNYQNAQHRATANEVINSLRILDPAVGSGRFLLSALYELIAIKADLRVLEYHHSPNTLGRRVQGYRISVGTDDLRVVYEASGPPPGYRPGPASQPPDEERELQETLFYEKQTLLANCLFGVDINPIWVTVCRLRVWMALRLPGSDQLPGSSELPGSWPKLDHSIRVGNSLVNRFALDADLSGLFSQPRYALPLYRQAVETAKTTADPVAKAEALLGIDDFHQQARRVLQQQDPLGRRVKKVRQEVQELQNPSLFDGAPLNPTALARKKRELVQAEAEWEARRSDRLYHDAFEWRFEFPELLDADGQFIGFDVVLGNPPYGMALPESRVAEAHFRSDFSLFLPKTDSYALFIERAYRLLRPNGELGFIVPDTLLNLKFTEATRQFLLRKTQIHEIDLLPPALFREALVDTVLLFFKKQPPRAAEPTYEISIKSFGKKAPGFSFDSPEKEFRVAAKSWVQSGAFNLHSDAAELSLLDTIEARHPALGTFAELHSGIKTYEVGRGTPPQDEVVRTGKPFTDKVRKTADWSPFFEGKHVGRYELQWRENNWVWYGSWLAAPRLPEQFEGEKILLRKIIGPTLLATYVPDTAYCNTLLYVLKLGEKARISYQSLLGILNSRFIGWYIRQKFGLDAADTFPQILIRDLAQLPIPNQPSVEVARIGELVGRILKTRQVQPGADTRTEDAEIDGLVYALYGLNPEEIGRVEALS